MQSRKKNNWFSNLLRINVSVLFYFKLFATFIKKKREKNWDMIQAGLFPTNLAQIKSLLNLIERL